MADPSDRYFYSNSDPESNFYAVPGGVTHRGVTLPTSEHHMMHRKAMIMGDAETARKIAAAPTPKEAKALGRQVAPFDKELWDKICEDVVVKILYDKFSQPALKTHLLGIQGNIYEASPRDCLWGIGVGKAQAMAGKPHRGQNLLGKCLMEVRALLRAGEDDGQSAEAPPRKKQKKQKK